MADETPISKTQRKKRMLALQDLGTELVALNDEQLAAIELPEALRDAVLEARRITGFEARRRQLQYIGKLMRGADPAPIRAALEAWKARSFSHTAQLKRIELWRSRLLAGPGALAELLADYPEADAQRLRVLIRNTLRERATNRPPRSYRALHRALRALMEAGDEVKVTSKGDE
jgi:ribosome-associated protein